MPPSESGSASAHEPVVSLHDPRAIQIMSTEHWSLLASRSLAYNEAFIRGGMFLTFLSMSFVALALLAQGMAFDAQFLTVAAILLAFDLVIGLATYGRITGANVDDLRAVYGMARIRHGYTEAAPVLVPYFTTATHDDLRSVLTAYGSPAASGVGSIWYALTTSGGMIGLITAMVGGVLAAVLGLLGGIAGGQALLVGLAGGVIVLVILFVRTAGAVTRDQAMLPALFPASEQDPAAGPTER